MKQREELSSSAVNSLLILSMRLYSENGRISQEPIPYPLELPADSKVTVLREAWRATNDSTALLCMGTDCEAFFEPFVLVFELEAEPLTLSSCSVLMKQHVLMSFVLMVK